MPAALFEAAAYENPNAVVLGHSGIAVWMLLCGLLMPQGAVAGGAERVLCVLMWPLAYWVDLQIFGYQPMPLYASAGLDVAAGDCGRLDVHPE